MRFSDDFPPEVLLGSYFESNTMYDLILRNGRIMNGSGSPWYRADVAVVADRIATMGRNLEGNGTREIDASGFVASPGFIDKHPHSDVTLLVNPRAESAVRQGITTQIVGHYGFSAAPVQLEHREAFRQDSFVFSMRGMSGHGTTSLATARL